MTSLLALSHCIDKVTVTIGKNVSWVLLLAVVISCGNALSRYLWSLTSNGLLELQWYLYGTAFMFASAYTLQRNEHVRIDVLASRWSKATRDWVDLICHVLFLTPFCVLMVWLCWPWFIRSFNTGEYSSNVGGLIIWPAKGVVLIGFILLLAQAFSEIVKRLAVVMGKIDDPLSRDDATDRQSKP